jgi:post-GPI attachment to proteins factor 3
MLAASRGRKWLTPLFLALTIALLATTADASVGDRLPEFKECVDVCKHENCGPGKQHTPIRTHSNSGSLKISKPVN